MLNNTHFILWCACGVISKYLGVNVIRGSPVCSIVFRVVSVAWAPMNALPVVRKMEIWSRLLQEIENKLYLTDCQNSRRENGSESVNLDVFSLGESVFNQELLYFVALVTLKLKNVASISSVGNNGTVAAVGLQFVRIKMDATFQT